MRATFEMTNDKTFLFSNAVAFKAAKVVYIGVCGGLNNGLNTNQKICYSDPMREYPRIRLGELRNKYFETFTRRGPLWEPNGNGEQVAGFEK